MMLTYGEWTSITVHGATMTEELKGVRMMKLIEVHKGQTFSLRGCRMIYEGSENGSAYFRDVRRGKLIIHGFEAARITLWQYGYDLKEE